LIHFFAKFVAKTPQTDDSDPLNQPGPTRLFGLVWVQFSITRLNRVEYGSAPNPIRPDRGQP